MISNISISNPEMYKAAIYIRLSKEDDKKGESESISNQRLLLTTFAKDKKIKIIDEYIDDGISGTTFKRPSFLRMLHDIENQKINGHQTVMVSRKLWSLNLLEGWLAEMNTAVEKIEPLKTSNPAEYDRIYKMIAAERMSPVYMILRLYTSYYSDSDVLELAKTFRADTTLCNVSCLGPTSKTVNGVLSPWGV